MERLYTREEFARLAGVTPQAVGKACRKGVLGPAAAAGYRVDIAHPAAVEYLKLHGVTPPVPLDERPARAPTGSRKPRPAAAAAPPDPPKTPTGSAATPPAPGPKKPVRVVSREVENLDAVADMTIREVVANFGTVTAFRDWLHSLKTIEFVREKNLRNAETDGNLISTRLVKNHVLGAIESGNRRLLTDSPKTITRRCYAAARSDVPMEEAEQMVREIISAHLKASKDAAARTLRENTTPTT